MKNNSTLEKKSTTNIKYKVYLAINKLKKASLQRLTDTDQKTVPSILIYKATNTVS